MRKSTEVYNPFHSVLPGGFREVRCSPPIEFFEVPDEPKPFVLENVGSEAFTVAVIDGVPPGFTLAEDDCSRVTLEPGDSCRVSVSFDGEPEIGPLELDLSRPSGGEVAGDHTVVLVGGAAEAG